MSEVALGALVICGRRGQGLEMPTPSALAQAAIKETLHGREQGLTMGEIVDQLCAQGHPAELLEEEIWRLLAERMLTPCGYVARTLRRKDAEGRPSSSRCYEFLLQAWSPALDEQLELGLEDR